jgi:repressor LexA
MNFERAFVPCHERLFAVKPNRNKCSGNRCLTFPTERVYDADMAQAHVPKAYATPRAASSAAAEARTSAAPATGPAPALTTSLTSRQREILEVIDHHMRTRGYPPSVREIGEAVGLTSPSTVHNHLASLQRLGLLRRDPTKPRAIEVRWDPSSDAALERRPARSVPLLGDVAAGTNVLAQENVEELLPLPADFVGDGDLFMVRVRGDSMIDAGILDGDYVVARTQPSAENGDVVVAGIPGEEATVKTYRARGNKVTLTPANARLAPMVFDAADVTVFGRVVTVLRRL